MAASGHCAYCSTYAYPLVRDHRIPKSRGGTDAPENIALVCVVCNSRKGNRTPEEYQEYLCRVALREQEKLSPKPPQLAKRHRLLPVEISADVTDDEMTITEAAGVLGVHRTRVWQWVRDGKLASRQVGPILLVSRADVERLKTEPKPKRGRPRKSPGGTTE